MRNFFTVSTPMGNLLLLKLYKVGNNTVKSQERRNRASNTVQYTWKKKIIIIKICLQYCKFQYSRNRRNRNVNGAYLIFFIQSFLFPCQPNTSQKISQNFPWLKSSSGNCVGTSAKDKKSRDHVGRHPSAKLIVYGFSFWGNTKECAVLWFAEKYSNLMASNLKNF